MTQYTPTLKHILSMKNQWVLEESVPHDHWANYGIEEKPKSITNVVYKKIRTDLLIYRVVDERCERLVNKILQYRTYSNFTEEVQPCLPCPYPSNLNLVAWNPFSLPSRFIHGPDSF